MSIKALFFDIDNTLYDSATLSSMARKNSVKGMIDAGLDVDENTALNDLESIIKKHGSNYPRHYDELLENYGLVDPKVIAAGVVAYEHTKWAYLKPSPGVLPTLMELKTDYKLGVISNGLTIKQWEKLVGLGIHHFFDVVVTSQECGCEKPDLGIFKIALRAVNTKPDESVMIGDKLDVDIEGGKNAGMHTVQLTRDEPKNSYEITSFPQIKQILKGLK